MPKMLRSDIVPTQKSFSSLIRTGSAVRFGRVSSVLSVIICLFLAACGTNKTSPDLEPPGVGSSRYSDYKAKCLEATGTLDRANIVYDPDIIMTRGLSSSVTAVLTLKGQLPPDQILPGAGARSETLYVTCRVDGMLLSDNEEFDIQSADWQPRSLVGDQDAKWVWIVKPKVGGTRTLILSLRPMVTLSDSSGVLYTQAMTTASFESAVHVKVPPDQTVTGAATRAKLMFDSLSALAKSMTVLIGALCALGVALGCRRLIRLIRKRRRTVEGQ